MRRPPARGWSESVETRHRSARGGRPWTFYLLPTIFTFYVICALRADDLHLHPVIPGVRGGLVFPMKGFAALVRRTVHQVRTGDVRRLRPFGQARRDGHGDDCGGIVPRRHGVPPPFSRRRLVFYL